MDLGTLYVYANNLPRQIFEVTAEAATLGQFAAPVIIRLVYDKLDDSSRRHQLVFPHAHARTVRVSRRAVTLTEQASERASEKDDDVRRA